MNLADSSYLEWLAVQEVCLLIRDICDDMALDDVTRMDELLYQSNNFKIMKINNSILLQDNSIDFNDKATSFIFAANADGYSDNRPYSSRLNIDTGHVCVRKGTGDILVVDDNNWRYGEPRFSDEYLPTIINAKDEEELNAELFQKSLVYSKDEVNVMVMNFMLKDTICEDNNTETYIWLVNKIQRILDAHREIVDMRKKCLPNLTI